jgi:hypothetical protein
VSAVFAVVREHGPAWRRSLALEEQEGWREHAAFMNALADEGVVVLGGPLGDGERVLLAVAAGSADEVRARLAPDPWSGSMLVIASIEPWDIRLGGDGPSPPPPGATA